MDTRQADRERMKTLLVEAIATLCRNGLQYEEELSVEGLIGITLDRRDVFLVSVKESFNLEGESTAAKEDVAVGTDTQSLESNGSATSDIRRGKKRQGMPIALPAEKHKRKGAPKQIRAEEIELINNSPGPQDSSIDVGINEDSVSDSGRSERSRSVQGDDLNQGDNHRKKLVVVADEDEDIVLIDPDLAVVKKENVKVDAQNSCVYDSNQSVFTDSPQTVSRPPQTLHQRPSPNDPRNSHPSGLNQEQLSLAYGSSVKQEQGSESGDMFDNYGTNQSPVPVTMVANPSGSQPLEGLGDMHAFPVDWGNQSAQEFIPMPGDDSTEQSPSQQTPGSGGVSQQNLCCSSNDDNDANMDFKAAFIDEAPQLKQEIDCSSQEDNKTVTKISKTPETNLFNRKKKSYICALCERQFKNMPGLKRHLAYHKSDKFTCPGCDKKFISVQALEKHTKKCCKIEKKVQPVTPVPEKLFLCNTCGAIFKANHHLTDHMFSHTGNKPFKCSYENCNFSFLRKSGLEAHMNIHRGVKPFLCTKCNVMYRSASYLRVHMNKCVRNIRYICDVCGLKYRSEYQMKVHKKCKHENQKYKCICGKIYSWRGGLYRHSKKCELRKHK